jgi:hypothetical protein
MGSSFHPFGAICAQLAVSDLSAIFQRSFSDLSAILLLWRRSPSQVHAPRWEP